MSASHPAMDEQIPPSSAIQQAITAAKAGHPDSVVVYFIRHKSAASSLSKPTKPL